MQVPFLQVLQLLSFKHLWGRSQATEPASLLAGGGCFCFVTIAAGKTDSFSDRIGEGIDFVKCS